MQTLDLGGRWQVCQDGGAIDIHATVPGCIHTDLIDAGVIGDPFWRDREDQITWIGEATWIYRRTFDVDGAFASRRRVLLRCEGLDTVATVTLNGVELGRTENQFRTWEFDVRGRLTVGTNELVIRFDSPRPLQLQRMAIHTALVGGGSDTRSWKGRSTVRKSPCNYGWDWGPSMPTCGIWRPIGLVAFDTARLAGVAIRQEHRPGAVDLDVAVEAEVADPAAALAAEVVLTLDGTPVAEGR
ncbi:MAG: glycoside hydrolase family 2 protein, partial [Planctomycetes bacterium]|nr:glycoside hydrolase family 2 protein [Planctomycetota bacterium]